jgi:hypothetical protein
MDVVSDTDPSMFAQTVLRGVASLGPDQTDLSCELGLSLWMRQTRTPICDAGPAMLALRSALVEVSGMDLATEPIPLFGVDPRLDVLNLGAYLRRLMARATARANCDAALLVDRTLDRLRGGTCRPRGVVGVALT